MTEIMKNSKKKKILIGGAIILASFVLFFIMKLSTKTKEVKYTYTFTTLREKDPLLLKGNSVAKSTQTIIVDPSKGSVNEILVNNLQEVKVGDLLFTYKSETMDAQRSEAQSQYNRAYDAYNNAVTDLDDAKARKDENEKGYYTAKANLKEAEDSKNVMDIQVYTADVQKFEGKREASQQEVKQLERALSQAESNKEDAYTRLENAKKAANGKETASINGVVIINKDSIKGGTTPFMEVVTKETMVLSSVTEYDYEKVVKDKVVKLTVVPSKKEMEGKIEEISLLPDSTVNSASKAPSVGSSGINYSFKVTPSVPIPYGYSVEIGIGTGEVVIPTSAVIKENGKTYLWVLQGDKASKKEVTLKDNGTYTTLQAGLKIGDTIIENPDETLTEGKVVKVSE